MHARVALQLDQLLGLSASPLRPPSFWLVRGACRRARQAIAACAHCCKTLADARAHAAALPPLLLPMPPPTAATLPSQPPQPCAPLPPPAPPRLPGPAQRVQLPVGARNTQPCPAGLWHAVRWRHPALRCRRSATRWPQSWRSWASTSSAPASSTCPMTHGWVGGAAWQVLPAWMPRCGTPMPAACTACPSPACRPPRLAPPAAHSLLCQSDPAAACPGPQVHQIREDQE